MRAKTRLRNNRRGFSLIEALVALVLIEIGALGLLSLFGMVSNGNRYAQEHTAASALAEAKIEDLRVDGFGTLASGTFNDPDNPIDANGNPGGDYTRTWTVSTFNGVSQVRQVTVTVTWNSGKSGQTQVDMTSLISPVL